MIANERQYRITKAELRKFEQAIEDHKDYVPRKNVDPRIKEIMADALRSQADTLRSELRRYDDLREGRVSQREIDDLRELPTALIEARIAAGLTQRELAERDANHARPARRLRPGSGASSRTRSGLKAPGPTADASTRSGASQ